MRNDIRQSKVTCNHCGCIIDLAKGNICDNCGAVFDSKRHIQHYNDMQSQMNKLNIERAEAELEGYKLDNVRKRQQIAEYNDENNYRKSVKHQKRAIKSIVLTWIIIFAGLVLLATIGFFTSGDFADMLEEEMYKTPVVEVEPEIIEQPTEVGFNESAELIQYSVICDKAEQYNYPWTKPADGNYYVKLHLVISNKTDKKMHTPDDMICNYIKDGYNMAAKECTISSNDLGTRLYLDPVQPNSATEGWVYYEVPIGADLKLIYDEYITINIPYSNVVMSEN